MLYAAFLRAINVGAANRITMADLKAVCAEAGFAGVATYLQSGNLVFEAEDEGDTVAARLEAALAGRGLKNVQAMVRSKADVAAVVADCPMEAYGDERYRRFVTLFREPIPAGFALGPGNAHVQVVAVRARELVTVVETCAPNGVDVNGVLGKAIKIPATTRYWHVVGGVLELMDRR